MNTAIETTILPWYREPWPWLLMAGPAIVVVAGVITAWIAISTNDGVVADDYYKRGLAINQALARDAEAANHGYRARLVIGEGGGEIVTHLPAGQSAGPLYLHLAHAGRPALDRKVTLQWRADGAHAAALPPLSAGHWRMTLEDPARSWRLVGEVRVMPGQASQSLDMVPRAIPR